MESDLGHRQDQNHSSKKSVQLFLASAEKALLSVKVYSFENGAHTLDQVFKNVFSLLKQCFLESDEILVHLNAFTMSFHREPVYENKDRKKSLAWLLYDNGIRAIRVRSAITEDEIREWLSLLATDFTKPENMDQDLSSLLFEREFPNIETPSVDLVAEELQKNPELRSEVENFVSLLQEHRLTQEMTQRRVRQDDLKVLEEFRMNANQFLQSDEDVMAMVQKLAMQRAGGLEDRQTLERLALMGFHFLLDEAGSQEMSVGRDLLAQVALMTLDANQGDLLSAILKKIYQTQKDRPEMRGEYQKIVDSIFSPQNSFVFKRALKDEQIKDALLPLILEARSSAVRLMVFLLGELPGLQKVFAEPIRAELPNYSNWLFDELQAEPSKSCWEPLLHVLAQKPNRQFSKFLTSYLEWAGDAVKVKILRQCASIGTLETLSVFPALLQSPKQTDRIAAIQALSYGRGVEALKLIRQFMASKAFQASDVLEKEEVYVSLMTMGGDASYAWFEAEWMKPGEGIFKTKNQTERRKSLASTAFRAQPQFLARILEKTPLTELTEDLQSFLKSMKSKPVARKESS